MRRLHRLLDLAVREMTGTARRRRILGLALLMATPMLVVACSSDDERVDEPARSLRQQVQAIATDERSRGHDSQADALEDGEVTDAEYRQANLDAAECMERAGLEVTELEEQPELGGYSLGFRWEPGAVPTKGDQPGVIADECEQEFRLGVAQAWSRQNATKLTPEAARLLSGCFSAASIDVDSTASSLEQFNRAAVAAGKPDAFTTCLGEATEAILGPP